MMRNVFTMMVSMMKMVVVNKYDYQNDVSDNDDDHKKNCGINRYDRMKILSDDCKTWLQNSLASFVL